MTRPTALSLALAAILLSMTGFLACSGGPDTNGRPLEVDREDLGEVGPIDDLNGINQGTSIRRMTLGELDKSVTVAAGPAADGSPIFWQALAGLPLSALDNRAYGPVLGKPDFISLTSEDPSPSPLYVKFVQDLSRDVCTQMVFADATRPPNQAKVLWPHAPVDSPATESQIDENLGYLLLRFLGLEGDEASGRVTRLRTLYSVAKTDAEKANPQTAQHAAWGIVCIALFEDPAFHLH